jgi:hypothetical protein
VLPELVQRIIKSNSATASKLFADGTYDSNGVFRCLTDNGILPCIKVRKNARVGWKKGNTLWNLSVISQKTDLQEWKDNSVRYGKRWIAETVFSCIMRTFGEHVYSVNFENMVKDDAKSIAV